MNPMSLHARPVRVERCGVASTSHVPQTAHRCRPVARGPAPQCSSSGREEVQAPSTRRQLLGFGASILTLAITSGAQAAPFLSSTGAKGILADEETLLYNLRVQKEGEVRRELEAQRTLLEADAVESQSGKLCATPFGVDVVGITEFVGLLGALVGGISARQRKNEVEKLNEQLRTINLSLRQQARAGVVYAPGLSYVPALSQPGSGTDGGPTFAEMASDPAPLTSAARPSAAVASMPNGTTATLSPPAPAALSSVPVGGLLSMEEESMSPDAVSCRDALRAGKRLLKEQSGAAAMVRFEKALMLSRGLKDLVQERRAMRGLAAAARLQRQFEAAIKHLHRVLEISQALGDFTGDADAFGVIADCYTDLGEFDKAAVFYDKYIDRMSRDGPI